MSNVNLFALALPLVLVFSDIHYLNSVTRAVYNFSCEKLKAIYTHENQITSSQKRVEQLCRISFRQYLTD